MRMENKGSQRQQQEVRREAESTRREKKGIVIEFQYLEPDAQGAISTRNTKAASAKC
jgi:hypothetical protein